MKKIVANAVLLFISLSISLLVAEFAVKIFFPQNLSGTWRTLSSNGYLLNKSSVTAQHQLGDRIVHYRFNSHHLRGAEIDSSKYNVLVFGDSFTFGWLLDEENTFASILQKYCNDSINKNIRLLNAGAGGWGTADFLAYLKEFGDSVNPEMVIVFMNSDDIGRSIHRNLFLLPGNVFFKITSFFSKLSIYNRLLEHSHLTQLIRKIILNKNVNTQLENNLPRIPVSQINSGAEKPIIPLAKNIFGEMSDWCKLRSIPFMVTTTGWLFYTQQYKDDPTSVFILKADSIFSELGIPYHDGTKENQKIIGNYFSEYVIKGDNHPNEKGARVIANSTWQFLKFHIKENCCKAQ